MGTRQKRRRGGKPRQRVILATGGFGANPEMIKEETNYEFGKTIFNFAVPG